MYDDEQILIEKLNDLDAAWRDTFYDVWEAARHFGLTADGDYNDYSELDFDHD